MGIFNKTIILLPLVGYEMIIANSPLRASLAIYLEWYYDQKITSFFSFDFESVFAKHPTGKIWTLCFIRRLFILSVSFGFHGPPLLTRKTDRSDIRGLDLEKMASFTHYLNISACKRNSLYMQNTGLKVWNPETPVLHINSAAYTGIAFLN